MYIYIHKLLLIPLVSFEDDGNSDRDIVEQHIHKHSVKTLEARVKRHFTLFSPAIILLVIVRQVIQKMKDKKQQQYSK